MNLVEKIPFQNNIQLIGIAASALVTLIVLSSCGQKDPAGGTNTAPTNYAGDPYSQTGYPNGYPTNGYPNNGVYPPTYQNGVGCQPRSGAYVTQVSTNICRYEYRLPYTFSAYFSFGSSNSAPQLTSTGIPVAPGDRLYFTASGGGCGSQTAAWVASDGIQMYSLGNQSTVQMSNRGMLSIGMNASAYSGYCYSTATIQELRVVHCEDHTGASVICQ